MRAYARMAKDTQLEADATGLVRRGRALVRILVSSPVLVLDGLPTCGDRAEGRPENAMGRFYG